MIQSIWISAGVVLLCALWMGWRGYQRGVIRTLQRPVSLVAAYVASYFLLLPLAHWLQTQMAWQAFTAYLVSALGCFFISMLLVNGLIERMATAMENHGVDVAPLPGALLGTGLGVVLGLLLAWLVGILGEVFPGQSGRFSSVAMDPLRQMVGHALGGAVEQALETQLEPNSPLPAVASQLASDPLKLSQQVMQLSQSDALRNLFRDPEAQQLMITNQIDALQKNLYFQQLMAQPQAVEMLSVLGSSHTRRGSEQEQAAYLLVEMYQRIYRVQQDPRFVQLSQTAEFKQLSQNPSPLAMIANPAFGKFSEIIMDPAPVTPATFAGESGFQKVEALAWQPLEAVNTEVVNPEAANTEAPVEEVAAVEMGQVMYRWTDEAGRKHFSENKPEGNYAVDVIHLDPH